MLLGSWLLSPLLSFVVFSLAQRPISRTILILNKLSDAIFPSFFGTSSTATPLFEFPLSPSKKRRARGPQYLPDNTRKGPPLSVRGCLYLESCSHWVEDTAHVALHDGKTRAWLQRRRRRRLGSASGNRPRHRPRRRQRHTARAFLRRLNSISQVEWRNRKMK